MRSDPDNRPSNDPAQPFVTTQWSAVLAAAEEDSPAGKLALEQLCQSYWPPLYAYVRRKGYGHQDAEDLTQEFFRRLLEHRSLRLVDRARGRFRTFLLAALKNFLINELTKANRQKRGGTVPMVSLDEGIAGSGWGEEAASPQSADTHFDRGWAKLILERALAALGAEFEQAGKRDLFERLKPYVWGDRNALSYAGMASALGLSEGAVKVAVHRLRQRYGDLLRSEVAQTVSTPVEVEEELRYLASVVRDDVENPGNPGAPTR